MNLPNKIFLVGMPGSGKTTLGRQLAVDLEKPFIDLDAEIERIEKLSIPQIFIQKGEDYFRKKEHLYLTALIRDKKEFVLSTGGGTPCFYDGMDKMVSAGYVIYINVSTEEIEDRLKNSEEKRPLLLQAGSTRKKINDLLIKRQPYYSKANATVTGNRLTVNDILQKLSSQDLS